MRILLIVLMTVLLSLQAVAFTVAAPFVVSDIQSPVIERRVSTLADLKATTGSSTVLAVALMGRVAEGDGGGGTFRWLAGDQSANPGVMADTLEGVYVKLISPSDGSTGVWVRQYSGAVNVLWFGAGDSRSESANTIAFNAALTHGEVFIPEGEYLLNALDTLDHPINIVGVDWKTVLNFNTTGDGLVFDITTTSPLDEGSQISKIRFKNNTNIPLSFITIKNSRNMVLDRIIFISTSATYGILNENTYGTTLRSCRWNYFNGVGLKLLHEAAGANFSNSINLYSCDFSNGGAHQAIIQEGGDLKIYGGVIESSAPSGMVLLNTTDDGSSILFSGTYFEGTNDVFVKSPSSVTGSYPDTVAMLSCNFGGVGNSVDLGANSIWSFTGLHPRIGSLKIAATNSVDTHSPRLTFNQCLMTGFTFDASIGTNYHIVGKYDRLFTFSGTGVHSTGIPVASGSGSGGAIVVCTYHDDVARSQTKLYLLNFAYNGTATSAVEVSQTTLGSAQNNDWTFSVVAGNLSVSSLRDVTYKIKINYFY